MIVQKRQRPDSRSLIYPIPHRISQSLTLQLINEFLTVTAGGHRLQAVVTGLFEAFGGRFGSFTQVIRTGATSGNALPGVAGQIECRSATGQTILAIDAQHREVTMAQMRQKVLRLRDNGVCEAYVITCRGICNADEDAVLDLISREFASGQNIYVTELRTLCETMFAILGEAGRRTFLQAVSSQLQEHSDIHHRRAWAELLASV